MSVHVWALFLSFNFRFICCAESAHLESTRWLHSKRKSDFLASAHFVNHFLVQPEWQVFSYGCDDLFAFSRSIDKIDNRIWLFFIVWIVNISPLCPQAAFISCSIILFSNELQAFHVFDSFSAISSIYLYSLHDLRSEVELCNKIQLQNNWFRFHSILWSICGHLISVSFTI